MPYERKVIIFSVFIGIIMWILDALADPRIHIIPFTDLFIYGGSRHDLLMRLVILISFIIFGVLISRVLGRQRMAQEQLAEKTIYLDNILRSATEYAIATTDKDFRITYYNPLAEKFHGYKAEDVIGRTVQEMHTKDMVAPERFQKAVDDVRLYGEYWYTLTKNTDEGIRYIEARISGIYDKLGKLVGYANFSKDVTERRRAEEERDRLISELKDALSKVETLSGLLPICSYCKKIRDDRGYWNQIETYIRKRSQADFTHSICPECERKAVEKLEGELRDK